ncbi:hypothetical protein NO1_2033, partial [Candidatus Termititenax aidoneus]
GELAVIERSPEGSEVEMSNRRSDTTPRALAKYLPE